MREDSWPERTKRSPRQPLINDASLLTVPVASPGIWVQEESLMIRGTKTLLGPGHLLYSLVPLAISVYPP